MKHLFIINPAAGSIDRTTYYRSEIEKLCSSLQYEIVVSKYPGYCSEIAREAGLSGKETRIYACGGDGTLNEVVSGAAGFPNLAVTVFSGGSGNDFVKLFSEPKAFFQLERLLDAEETEFDLIDCNGDLSLNICSVGLDARIGTDVAKYKRFPLLSGFRAYAVSTVVNVFRGISNPYEISINGETISGEKTLICVCNGQYYGGGFHPVPEANPQDGYFDVLVVDKVSRFQVVGVIGKYKNGYYKDLSQFIRYFRTKHIEISSPEPTPINLDGELRMASQIVMQISDLKLRFFYPKGLSILS